MSGCAGRFACRVSPTLSLCVYVCSVCVCSKICVVVLCLGLHVVSLQHLHYSVCVRMRICMLCVVCCVWDFGHVSNTFTTVCVFACICVVCRVCSLLRLSITSHRLPKGATRAFREVRPQHQVAREWRRQPGPVGSADTPSDRET
jgi:hypothetical protein